jgi:uncharacterized OB-fold protein
MVEAVRGILKKTKLETKDISKAILPAPDLRTHKGLVQKLGFDIKTQVQDPLIQSVGHCGAAQALIMLVNALEEARPGELLLLANYADGADALIFRTTDRITQAQHQKKIKDFLNQKLMLTSYARFLSYKGLVEAAPGEPFRLFPSATVSWRDQNSVLKCQASKCRECGTTTFPVQRICVHCQSKDQFVEVPISETEGEIFTFTLDNLAGRSDDPVVVQSIADMGQDKVRFYGLMTDCVPAQVKVGMPVSFTFRRIYDGMGIHNYFWKLRPLSG